MRAHLVIKPPSSLHKQVGGYMRSDNLQLHYKFDSHQLIMVDRVIIFKMVIMVEMVIMAVRGRAHIT